MRNRLTNTNDLLLLREEFVRSAADFETALAEATTMPDITAASAQLAS